MMAEHDLVEMVQIAVEDLGQEDQSAVLENHEDVEGKPDRKRARLDISSQDTSLKSLLFAMNQSICQRLDSMEAKLQVLEATCRALEEKLDSVVNKNQGPIQVPMVAGSPLGATQTWNKVRCVVPQTNVIVSGENKPKAQEETNTRASESLENLLSNTVGGRRQNTILVKVPAHEESQDEQESGSETSDSMPGPGSAQNHNNVTLITLNSEGHLFHKFAITESDWYRIKQSIDSKCRTAWRRKQRGQSLAVKSFSRRTPSSQNNEAGTVVDAAPIEATQQALHYALANPQQVQIHRIAEDGQVQVIPQGHLHIAQVPQGEQVQITQDSEGNLQIHQVHVGQDGQVVRGPQLIAVASADPGATGVEASPLQGNDIQVQYVQLAPVTDHTATVQADGLAPALQAEMEVKDAIQIQQGENGEVVQIQMPVSSVGT
ncbi:protein BANP isoform X5 [Alosa sapidissima]|uniref:protein BANP isoform X5 n=1 Tax=Alosa sapidissima TaxID=34773 RepID=UPI001C082E7C|nr:protein BANP isoform X5 [Alosa sapidissima]